MPIRHSTNTRNDLATQLAAIYPAGAIARFYSAAQTDPNAAPAGTLLGTLTIPASPWAAAAAGSVVNAVLFTGVGEPGLGAPTSIVGFRLANAAGTRVTVGSVGLTGSGADLQLDNVSIAANQEVRFAAGNFVLSIPELAN
jgi:hypothetical protein